MKKIKIIGIIICLLLISVVNIWASEHAGGAEGGLIPPAWMDFIWRCINFVIFAGIIYYLVGGRTKEFLGGRRQQIRSELSDLESRKVEAEKRLQEVENSISNIEQERQEILEQAKEQGEAIRKSIITKAEESAERIKKQAEIKSSQEMQQVMESLRAEMADKIIDSAEKIIKSRLSKKEQERLIENYLTKVVLN